MVLPSLSILRPALWASIRSVERMAPTSLYASHILHGHIPLAIQSVQFATLSRRLSSLSAGAVIRNSPIMTLRILESQRYFSHSSKDRISSEEYAQASDRVNQLSKLHLARRGITSEMLSGLRNIEGADYQIAEVENVTKTANLRIWQVMPSLNPLQIDSDGIPVLLHSDKEVLIKIFYALMERRIAVIKNKILIINEGCDSGDYLSLLIPVLLNSTQINENSIEIYLTNGHEQKLKFAYRLAVSLLPSKGNVFITYMNAFFDNFPKRIEHNSDVQKLFLFFRLVIVEHPDIVRSFIQKRLKYMQPGDMAIASFLLADDLANKAMSSYQLDFVDRPETGDRLFTKSIPIVFQKKLRQLGVEGDLSQRTNAAFTQAAIQTMIEESGGNILNINSISSKTDEGFPINICGVIFQKKDFN